LPLPVEDKCKAAWVKSIKEIIKSVACTKDDLKTLVAKCNHVVHRSLKQMKIHGKMQLKLPVVPPIGQGKQPGHIVQPHCDQEAISALLVRFVVPVLQSQRIEPGHGLCLMNPDSA
jgi:hypothetical protein